MTMCHNRASWKSVKYHTLTEREGVEIEVEITRGKGRGIQGERKWCRERKWLRERVGLSHIAYYFSRYIFFFFLCCFFLCYFILFFFFSFVHSFFIYFDSLTVFFLYLYHILFSRLVFFFSSFFFFFFSFFLQNTSPLIHLLYFLPILLFSRHGIVLFSFSPLHLGRMLRSSSLLISSLSDVDIITRLEFELAFHDLRAQHISRNTTHFVLWISLKQKKQK